MDTHPAMPSRMLQLHLLMVLIRFAQTEERGRLTPVRLTPRRVVRGESSESPRRVVRVVLHRRRSLGPVTMATYGGYPRAAVRPSSVGIITARCPAAPAGPAPRGPRTPAYGAAAPAVPREAAPTRGCGGPACPAAYKPLSVRALPLSRASTSPKPCEHVP